jgi:hypothetical protein
MAEQGHIDKPATNSPWYQRWTTYLSGVSGLLAILLTFTHQGNQIIADYVLPIYHYFSPAAPPHDTVFEASLEQSIFLNSPKFSAFTKLFGGVVATTSLQQYTGYAFENDKGFLFFATATDREKIQTLKVEPRPAAILVGFKTYPQFIHRFFSTRGVNFEELTIRQLQKAYAGHIALSGYTDEWSGNFITVFDTEPKIFDRNASIFFFPNNVGCGTSGKTLELFSKKKKPNEISPVEMKIDQFDCKNIDSKGYLLGFVSYASKEAASSPEQKVELEQSTFDFASFDVLNFYFILTYGDETVGYTKRKFQLVKPVD